MKMSNKSNGILGRIASAGGVIRRGAGLYTGREVAHALNVTKREAFHGQRATVIETSEYAVIDKVLRQPYSFDLLETYSDLHPFLTITFGAIVRSIIKNGWTSRAKFAAKCKKCGTEYKEPVYSCTTEINGKVCGRKRFHKPQWSQRKRLDAFIQDPNKDDEMKDIIESLMRHILPTANGYLYISKMVQSEIAIYVENSAQM